MSLFDQLRRSILGKNEQTATSDTHSNSQAEKAPAQEDRNTERRRRRRVDARKGTRVLIIDDSPTIVTALKKLLTSAKYVTYEAFDAETGLQIAQAEQPELIFLDIVLPGMNGFAALRLMRRDPKTQHIPIIMISGNEQATEQFYANRIGADDFMKKPFSRFEVFARIEGLLDAHHIPRRKGAVEESPPPRANATPPVAQTPATSAGAAQTARPTTATANPSPQAASAGVSAAATATPRMVAAASSTAQVAPAAPATGNTPVAPHTTFVQSVTLQPTIVQPAYSPQIVVKPVVHQTTAATPPTPRTVAMAPPPLSPHASTPPSPSSSQVPQPSARPQETVAMPAAPPTPATAAPPGTAASSSPLEARKELTLMGLQYFDQQQFIAAIKRGDKLAFELFVAGGGVDLNAEVDGKTPLQVARENGRTQIFAILRSKLAAGMNQ